MQDAPHRRATYADLEAAPPNLVAELINGVLVTHPRPRSRHSHAEFALPGILMPSFGRAGSQPGGWWFGVEPELHLDDHVVVPDLAGWRREQMPDFPDAAFFTQAPDWLCEIPSPSTARYDRGAKRDIYGHHGVRHLWHLDPDAKMLETFELRDGLWVLLKTYTDNDEVAAPPFAAVPFALGLLWPD